MDGSVVETYADSLPRRSIVTMGEEVGGVDSINVLNWAVQFLQDNKDLTVNNRKLILIYDGYRSHMSVPVLEILHKHNTIDYALPAHTSGKTQPLDFCAFSPFKAALNEALNMTVKKDAEDK